MYLLTQLWLYLLLASILGFLVGWFMYRTCFHSRMAGLLEERTGNLIQARSQIDDLAVEVKRFETDWRSTVALLEKRDGELIELDERFASTQSDLKESGLTLTHTLTSLKKAEEALNLTTSELASSRKTCDVEQSDHKKTRVKLDEKIVDLGRIENDAAKMRSELESARDQTLELGMEITSFRSESRQFEANWKAAVATLAARDESLRTAEESLGDRDKRLIDLRNLLEKRGDQLEEVQSLAEERESEVRIALADRARIRDTLDDLRKKHEPCEANLVSVQTELESSRSALQGIRKRLASIETVHGKCPLTLAGVRSELGTVKSEYQILESECDAARVKAGQFETDWREVFNALETRDKELAHIQSQKESERERATGFERELLACQAKAQTARSEWEKVVSALENELISARESAMPSNVDFEPAATAAMSVRDLETAVLAAGPGHPPRRLFEAHDDLTEIGGVGPQNEKWLHEQGIFHFWQIASWEVAEAAWVSQQLPTFGGRVYRENWMDQASTLARGGMTEAKRQSLGGNHI